MEVGDGMGMLYRIIFSGRTNKNFCCSSGSNKKKKFFSILFLYFINIKHRGDVNPHVENKKLEGLECTHSESHWPFQAVPGETRVSRLKWNVYRTF